MSRRRSIVFIPLLVLVACGGGRGGQDGPPPDASLPPGEDFDIPTTLKKDLDLLFVVDNSGSMSEEQQSLVANFAQLLFVMDSFPGGFPSLHLGVISSDMGTNGVATGDPSCSDPDNGNLIKGNPDLPSQCTMVTGSYIFDVDDGAGGRARNYTGTLAEAFACTATLGNTGCGFEQHLASMRAALDGNPINNTFLRPLAYLGVIFLADEDDCSAADGRIFGPETPALGPVDSFRCFEKAVACNEGRDIDLRAEGAKTGCHVDDTQDYLSSVAGYADFLRGLKADPRDVIVAGIIGDSTPVVVGRRTPMGSTIPRPDVIESCQYTDVMGVTNGADPGIRLQAFFERFPGRNTYTTICDNQLTDALVQIGELIRRAFGYSCLDGLPVDADGDSSNGIQPDCTFSYVTDPGQPTEVVTALSACNDGLTNRPCWHLVSDVATCPDTQTNLAVVVERTVEPPANTHIIGRCSTE